MSNQTRFDANHIRIFRVAIVGHFGRLFGTGIPHHGRHGRHVAVHLTGPFDAQDGGAARVDCGMYDGMVVGVQIDAIGFSLDDNVVVVTLNMILFSRNLFCFVEKRTKAQRRAFNKR